MDCGADVQKSDKFGSTSLYWACRKGHYECAKLLLRADVDPNAVGANGQSQDLQQFNRKNFVIDPKFSKLF